MQKQIARNKNTSRKNVTIFAYPQRHFYEFYIAQKKFNLFPNFLITETF